MSAQQNKTALTAEEIAAASDTGGRNLTGSLGFFVALIAFIWSCFQLYTASGVPYFLTELTGLPFVFNDGQTRIVHLAFALALAMFSFPLFKSGMRHSIPWYDWVLAAAGVSATLYLLVFRNDIAARAGLPTSSDIVASAVGLSMLAVAVYRSLGLPMLIVALVFVMYVFFGDAAWLPDVVQWKGASFSKALWHYWMQTEGVFGLALGVSASIIFLFVLFGSLLEKAGAGNYFIKLAFGLLGHMRGGPAKAAVVASAMSGLYSGSSISNVVTTGTFTIPLMKRTGFSPEKAGAVEVASSTNGQLTPPVMGAAAFLITEFVGVSYPELMKNAILPALISYIALVYIVHLEAMKMNLKGLEKPASRMTLAQKLMGVVFGFLLMCVLAFFVNYVLGAVKVAFPDMTVWAGSALFLVAYLVLVWVAAKRPDLEVDDPNAPMLVLPRAGDVALTGLHFLLPIVVLLWAILHEGLSPATSAFWATIAMVFVVLTQHTIKSIFRGTPYLIADLKRGASDFWDGMIAGARNMIAIGVATGVAGVIIGSISLTGFHQVIGELIEFLSGGNLMLMLVLVAVMSLVLGMGLPTTANYIVVSSLMAPVIVTVGAQSGLIVPLVAVHLFVFYFGILADDTPPVGLAAFAAAAISGGDPIKTGIQGFAYDIRTALLPFLFIFNTELLLINVSPAKAVFVFIVATIAMMLFAAATQGFWFVKSKLWESAALLLIALTLFRPGFWLDQVVAPYDEKNGIEAIELAGKQPADGRLRVVVEGPDFDNPDKTSKTTIMVNLGAEGEGASRLESGGLIVVPEGDIAKLEEPIAGTPYFTRFRMFDFYSDKPVTISKVEIPAERIAKEVFYIPALLLLGLVFWSQRRRRLVPVKAKAA
ncbi:MAG: TRAP transporter permease [Anderseniella sp.]